MPNKLIPLKYFKERTEITKKIPGLTNINCNYRNPTDQDPFGYIEIDSLGIIKQIQIRFRGDITIYEGGVNKNFKYYVNYNTCFIVLSNITKHEVGTIKLIKFQGYISSLVRFRAFGFNNTRKNLVIKPPKTGIELEEGLWDEDETMFPLNTFQITSADDTGLPMPAGNSGLPKYDGKTKYNLLYNEQFKRKYKRNRSKNVYTNYSTFLPQNYRVSDIKNNICGNCIHIKNKFCKLWRSTVNYKYVCNSWDNNRGVKKEFEVVKATGTKQ